MNKTHYLWKQILAHVSLFFSDEALSILKKTKINFLPLQQAIDYRGDAISIPIDIPYNSIPEKPFTQQFNNTQVTFWNPISPPAEKGWEPVPKNTNPPLWFRHESGNHIPSWNLFGILFGLLSFQEEQVIEERDNHSRFLASFSPRQHAGLLEKPIFNDAVAVLVAACIGLDRGNGAFYSDIKSYIGPPCLVLSHDCDLLHGNDIWTQATRFARILLSLKEFKLPKISNIWWILKNFLCPTKYYFNNIVGMILLEKMFGYTSTFYLLNGTGGRFGARSGTRLIPEVIREVPENWRVGIHYNYDTYLNEENFQTQYRELTELLGRAPAAGRAHYLRFDSCRSFSFWESQGIRVDESAGYNDRIGYRCGLGGCFQAYDLKNDKPLDIWEVPLIIMDSTILTQYQEETVSKLRELLSHMKKVGGAVSVLFHPGVFFNPEFPEFIGLYHKILQICRDLEYRSKTAESLWETVKTWISTQ